MSERIINAERIEQIINVFGSFDENIKRIEQTYGVKITNRGTELKISGEDEAADRAGRAIEGLLLLAAKGETIDEQKVRYLIDLVSSGNEDKIGEMAKDVVCITAKGRPVKAKTLGQQRYMKAISKNTITIGVGPAGTGKTYLAVAAAVAAFREKAVNRIILTRPAVEAGERLGFLPGDLQNKVDPYLRPLYDALYDMLGADRPPASQGRAAFPPLSPPPFRPPLRTPAAARPPRSAAGAAPAGPPRRGAQSGPTVVCGAAASFLWFSFVFSVVYDS